MKTLKRIATILGLLITLLACIYYFYIRERYIDVLHTQIKINDFSSDDAGIENMINWYFETYHVPAISAAIVENGQVSKFISRGKLNKDSQVKTDENTIFQIASISKMLTGIICSSLEMEGLLDLDKPIIASLSEELTEKTKDKLKSIKLRHLLYHNSGLGRSMKGLSKKDIIASLEQTELEFKPESKWQYSNYAYALIAFILEKETGNSYQQLLTKYVKNKYNLEVCDTGLENINKKRLATAYWKHFKLLENKAFDFSMQNAASGIFTTTKSLSELMIKQIAEYQKADSAKNKSPLFLNKNKVTSYSDDGFYGYGIFEKNFKIRYDSTKTHNYLAHGGDADGYVSNYGFFPKYGKGIIVLSSSGGPWFWDMERNLNIKLLEKHLKGK